MFDCIQVCTKYIYIYTYLCIYIYTVHIYLEIVLSISTSYQLERPIQKLLNEDADLATTHERATARAALHG